MKQERIEVLFDTMIDALIGNELNKAIEIAEVMEENYPDQKADTLLWCACLYARNNDVDKVVQCFDKALAKGVWWSQKAIDTEPEFDGIRQNQHFIAATEKMKAISGPIVSGAQWQVDVVQNDPEAKYIVNLHWKNDNVAHYAKYFEEAHKQSPLNILYVQSSQVESSKGFNWDNETLAVDEIKRATQPYANKIEAFCGTSQGGRVALQMAMENNVNYIGIMPAIGMPEVDINTNISYQFIIGDQDHFYNNIVILHERILAAGASSRLVIMPGISHYFPDDFNDYFSFSF